MNRKQIQPRGLLAEQLRFEDRRLAASFVEMAGALPCRPEPRHLFDNAASPGRTSYRGLVVVLAARAAMRDAIKSGERATIEETAKRIEHHFDDAKACALLEYFRVVSGAVSLDDAIETASRETADLSVSLTHLALRHDAEARDEAIREIDADMLRLFNLRACLATTSDLRRFGPVGSVGARA
jgi:hypothetical protein